MEKVTFRYESGMKPGDYKYNVDKLAEFVIYFIKKIWSYCY